MALQFQTNHKSLSDVLTISPRDTWGWFLGEGAVLSLLVLAATFVPFMAGLSATVWLGCLLLSGGIVGLVAAVRALRAGIWADAPFRHPGMALVAVPILLRNPLHGLHTVDYVLTAYFLADIVFIFMLCLNRWDEIRGQWGWMLLNAVVDIALAAFIYSGIAGTLVWVFGLMVGLDLLFGAGSVVGMAIAARKSVWSDHTKGNPLTGLLRASSSGLPSDPTSGWWPQIPGKYDIWKTIRVGR